jgi:hypothetical protein
MGNSIKIIMFLFIALNFNTTVLFSAMDDEISAGGNTVLDEIVYERERANQEYQRYIKDKQVTQIQPVSAPIKKPIKHAETIASKKELITGIALIAIALLLTIYLHKSRKNRKKE